nr:hypothetical protein [Tanacetum cinerariifolium]
MIEKTVNKQLKADVLTRASNSLKTSYVVAADLSELELKKILIEKIENNKIIAVTKLQIVEWHNYKHLDWITMRKHDDKLYKFKEGGLKRLCIQDIEDMLLLLVQGKLTNLTVEECFAFNIFLRMFTRSIVIQRHVEDLQLGNIKGEWRYLFPAEPQSITTCSYPTNQDFRYSDVLD